MKHKLITFLLCMLCIFALVSCGNNSIEEPEQHTHSLKERHVDAPCYSIGYTETYCEYCNYSHRVMDDHYGEHSYRDYYETDVESGIGTPGVESRHCEWYEYCGMSVDSREKKPIDDEDFEPKPL